MRNPNVAPFSLQGYALQDRSLRIYSLAKNKLRRAARAHCQCESAQAPGVMSNEINIASSSRACACVYVRMCACGRMGVGGRVCVRVRAGGYLLGCGCGCVRLCF